MSSSDFEATHVNLLVRRLWEIVESRGSDGRGPRAWQFAAQRSEFNAGSADIAHGFVDAARSATQNYNVQAGLNWWPNKYTHFNLDYAWTGFNCAILITGPAPVSQHNTVWLRFAMFF